MSRGKCAFVSMVFVAVMVSGSTLTPVFASARSDEVVVGADQPSDDWLWVRYLATSHPCSLVRIAAQSALISSVPDQAIAEFIATGFDEAVALCRERQERDLEFIRWVYETTTSESSPTVHAEAERLLSSGVPDSERETFVQTGYEAAQARDKQLRDMAGEQKRALAQQNREFVRRLSVSDPGEQVRLSASYAVRDGATDDDVVEFFAYGWAFGARLDVEVFRERRATDNTRWRADAQRLVADAEADEKVVAEASDAAKDKVRAAAVQGWRHVGEQAAVAGSAWRQAQGDAAGQVSNWRAVGETARSATGSAWVPIVDLARDSESSWVAEHDMAVQQAAYWDGVGRQARDGEARVQVLH
jgi:hypothetical protein